MMIQDFLPSPTVPHPSSPNIDATVVRDRFAERLAGRCGVPLAIVMVHLDANLREVSR